MVMFCPSEVKTPSRTRHSHISSKSRNQVFIELESKEIVLGSGTICILQFGQEPKELGLCQLNLIFQEDIESLFVNGCFCDPNLIGTAEGILSRTFFF